MFLEAFQRTVKEPEKAAKEESSTDRKRMDTLAGPA